MSWSWVKCVPLRVKNKGKSGVISQSHFRTPHYRTRPRTYHIIISMIGNNGCISEEVSIENYFEFLIILKLVARN